MDLFCGAGGLTLGIAEAARRQRLGVEVTLAVDADPVAAAVFGLNFPEAHVVASPIEKLFNGAIGKPMRAAEKALADKMTRPDVLVAGAPCQGHSDLNNHTRRQDPRNRLYLRSVRAVEILKPAFVVFENVPTVRHDSRGVVDVAQEELEGLGYRTATAVINLGNLGVPQRRRRHLLLATRVKGADPDALLDLQSPCDHTPRGLRWAIGDLASMKATSGYDAPALSSPVNTKRIKWLFDNAAYDLPNRLRPECHWGDHSYAAMYGRLRWNLPAQTITTGFGSMGQGRYVHPGQRRTLTPHEAARLQTFPDFFDFGEESGRGAWARMIGNAVPPLLTTRLAANMLPALPWVVRARARRSRDDESHHAVLPPGPRNSKRCSRRSADGDLVHPEDLLSPVGVLENLVPASDLPGDSEVSGGTDVGHTGQMPGAGIPATEANFSDGPPPWDAVLIDGEGPTSVVGIAQQGRLVREESDGPRRVDLTWIDEAALALIDRAVDRRHNLHLVYPAPAGELSVLVAAQLLLHRFSLRAPNLTVGIVTADTTRAARTWESLRIATTGSREPVAEVFPCFRAGPEGESPLGHRKIPGVIIGRRVRDWQVDVLIEDHLAGPVIGNRQLPTIGLYADPLDPALGKLAGAGEPMWGWDNAELAAWNSTLEVHTEGTVAFSVAHERLDCMARGTEVLIEVARHPEAEEAIARLREDMRLLREFAGSNPSRHVSKGMSVAWHHLSTLVSLPTTPTYFDHFAGVPPWAARATASFEHEMASWANGLTGDIGEVASVLASDMGDLRAALDRGNPLAEVAATFASENPDGLLIVRNHTAARAFLDSMEDAGVAVRAQVTSMGRIHREGTWQRAVALGAPRRWDWHHLDSGIASDLHVAVLGDADARSCQWGVERAA